jgi:asparagine synthetase B (glutamine-hydrolysing)
MPGLFGLIDLAEDGGVEPEAASAILAEMARRMSHTGTESVETWADFGRGFAIARVGQLHLHRIPWPRHGENSHTGIAFADGVLHGGAAAIAERLDDLSRRGTAALPGLRGSFSVARWEPDRRRLTLGVDRRASRPLVFTVVRGALYFAPEAKALLAIPGVDRSPDEAALGVFLGAGYLLGHQTLFASMRRLTGGEALVAEPGRHRLEAYWRYRLSERGDGTSPAALEAELGEILRESVERSVDDVDRTVVFLSGGVDSRAIAECAAPLARRRGRRLNTVTWACPDEREGSDVEMAAALARALGSRHRTFERTVGGYAEAFAELNYLLDASTDVAAYHPHEYTIMRRLAEGGVTAVLRGDECFGWNAHVGSVEEALLSMNLRKLRPLKRVGRVVRPGAYERWCEASAAALDAERRPLEREHPDNAKDLLYFRHRLQGYLNPAAYMKQAVLDHRAPLVDEAVLDFNERVPARLRVDKALFRRAARRLSPELWEIPLATRDNLEDFGALLASPSPVRRHVEAELSDRRSGLWELVDPDALRRGLPPLGLPASRSPAAALRDRAKKIVRAALRVAPSVERSLVMQVHRGAIRFEQICLRAMVLKGWHDLFVDGDGSRRALEARLGRAQELDQAA